MRCACFALVNSGDCLPSVESQTHRIHSDGMMTFGPDSTAQRKHAEAIVSRITGSVKTRTIGTNNNGTQINDMYELVSHPSVKSAALLVSRGTDNSEFVTIAFMGIK